ncbi:hypothetical protein T484DRAFT_1842214 [Baffinella frigidus]|nr:hypothetical protein T484DRAFT_1842214 [Cryptophyta sp. CCMP2293]
MAAAVASTRAVASAIVMEWLRAEAATFPKALMAFSLEAAAMLPPATASSELSSPRLLQMIDKTSRPAGPGTEGGDIAQGRVETEDAPERPRE